MSKPRSIGTSAETAVVKLARSRGIPAERRALAGRDDQGDVWLAGGRIVLEVKAHKTFATPRQINDWMAETARETTAAAAVQPAVEFGALVVKRPGSGPANAGDWAVHLRDKDFIWLLTGLWLDTSTPHGLAQIRLEHLIDGLIVRMTAQVIADSR